MTSTLRHTADTEATTIAYSYDIQAAAQTK